MENAGYLFATFAIIWVLFFAYLVILHNKQRKLDRELEALKSAMSAESRDS